MPLVSDITFRNFGRITKSKLSGILTLTRNQKLNSSPRLLLRDILLSLAYVYTIYLPFTANETQDVDWHAYHENIFASVGDDKMLMM